MCGMWRKSLHTAGPLRTPGGKPHRNEQQQRKPQQIAADKPRRGQRPPCSTRCAEEGSGPAGLAIGCAMRLAVPRECGGCGRGLPRAPHRKPHSPATNNNSGSLNTSQLTSRDPGSEDRAARGAWSQGLRSELPEHGGSARVRRLWPGPAGNPTPETPYVALVAPCRPAGPAGPVDAYIYIHGSPAGRQIRAFSGPGRAGPPARSHHSGCGEAATLGDTPPTPCPGRVGIPPPHSLAVNRQASQKRSCSAAPSQVRVARSR